MILPFALYVLYLLLRGYFFIMIIGVILTWIPSSYEYKIPRIIRTMTGWYLDRFSGVIVLGNIDFTTFFGLLLYEGILNMLLEI